MNKNWPFEEKNIFDENACMKTLTIHPFCTGSTEIWYLSSRMIDIPGIPNFTSACMHNSVNTKIQNTKTVNFHKYSHIIEKSRVLYYSVESILLSANTYIMCTCICM